MIKTKQQISKICIVLMVTIFTVACGNTKQNEEHEHGDTMNGDQTEMMEDDDHLHEDGNHHTDGN